VVDEIHAFAGDDRGWHLLAVLDRIVRLAGHPLQRIGLSATVGNPAELLQWLVAGSDADGVVIAPPALAPSAADVTIDYVGNIQNAATVLKLLYAGEKRLVFCDSRARVEELAALLRSEGVPTFVSHSSLSVEERRDAERAFREGRDCVIVATSTLELGIDVGDLDRVIQIDAPATVASFLQRLGRTGRRSGTKRNCLFLATSPEALLQAAALVELWRQGYVEPIKPPDEPYHLFAQQVLTILLQHGTVPASRLLPALAGLIRRSACLNETVCAEIVQHMLETRLLASDSGLLVVGDQAERLYGAKHNITLHTNHKWALVRVCRATWPRNAKSRMCMGRNRDQPWSYRYGDITPAWNWRHPRWVKSSASLFGSGCAGLAKQAPRRRPFRGVYWGQLRKPD
jgi:ATP-dependent helicase Lhr and Lhr-like helicase